MTKAFLKMIEDWQIEEKERKAKEVAIYDEKVKNVSTTLPTVKCLAKRVVELETALENLRKELAYSKSNEVPEYNMRNN